MPWKYNGQVVNTTKGFRNSDGYMSPKNWNVAWDDDTKKAEGLVWEDDPDNTPSDEAKLEALRQQRNNLLRECDYVVLEDSQVSNKDEWKTYRQALRDIPQTHAKDGYGSVVWPKAPSVNGPNTKWEVE